MASFYNQAMRIAPPLRIVLTSLALCAGGALAQGQAATAPVAATPASSAGAPVRVIAKPIPSLSLNTASPAGKSGADQLIERITVDDGGARISELRVGGETRSISVQPKGGMPTYDVRPISGADVQPTSGTRTWKILGF